MSGPSDPLVWLGTEREGSESLALCTPEGVAWSYGTLARHVRGVAAELRRVGVGPGAPVAFPATSTEATFALIHALIHLGAPLVPLHARFTDDEVAQVLALARPRMVVDLDRVRSWMAGHGCGQEPPSRSCAEPSIDPERALAIVTTSGTTGRPKGAVLSRRAFVASAQASALNLSLGPEDRWIGCMPLGHVGGLSIVTRCLLGGATVALAPRFEAAKVLQWLHRADGTLLSVVPTMLEALLDELDVGGSSTEVGRSLRSLRAILVGGAACPEPLLRRARAQGLSVRTTYGLTEACSQVSTQGPNDAPRPRGGAGLPLAGTTVRIVDERGRSQGPGVRGRIVVAGPTLFSGYLRAEHTVLERPALDASGGFDTGDWGHLGEDGTLFVEGRRGDLIVTGGENVSPAEIESVLLSLPGVRAALVFGVPDARWGQVVGAALVTSLGYERAQMLAALGARLAPHKRVRRLAEVSALPVTRAGKPDRLGAHMALGDLLETVG